MVLRQPLAADVLHDRVLGLLRRPQHLLHQRAGSARFELDRLQVGWSQLAAQQVGFDLHADRRTDGEGGDADSGELGKAKDFALSPLTSAV